MIGVDALTGVLNARRNARMEGGFKHGLYRFYTILTDRLHYKGPQQMTGCHLALFLMVISTTMNWFLSSRKTVGLVSSRDSDTVQGVCIQNPVRSTENVCQKENEPGHGTFVLL